MSAFPIRVHRGKFGIPNPLPPLGMGIQKFKTKITAQYDSRNAYFWWKGLLARDSIYAIARYICYRPFVRSSVRPSVLSVGLSVWFVCYTGESVKNCWSYDHATFTMTVVSSRLTSPRNSKGNIRIGAPNAWEKGKKTCNFQPIGRRISEMVQDKVPKSSTLDDLLLKVQIFSEFCATSHFWETTNITAKRMKVEPYY